jgi:undecaprenyl-diphosphatase
MEFLRNADIAALKFINDLAGRSVYSDAVLIFLAVYFIFIVAALHFLFFWRAKRLDLWFWSCMSAGVAYSIKLAMALIHFRSRPFVMDGITKLIDKSSTEASFPSGHTLISFALALGVFWFNRRWGIVFLVGALVVALSRIAVGVHYPSDILAGIIISFLLSFSVKQRVNEKHR